MRKKNPSVKLGQLIKYVKKIIKLELYFILYNKIYISLIKCLKKDHIFFN